MAKMLLKINGKAKLRANFNDIVRYLYARNLIDLSNKKYWKEIENYNDISVVMNYKLIQRDIEKLVKGKVEIL